MKTISAIFILILFFIPPFITRAAIAQPEQEESFDTFSIYIENDGFARETDQGYTGGLKMSWSTPFKSNRTDYHLPKWTYPMISRFPFFMDPDKKSAVSFSISTLIYTPADTGTKELIRDDRPYAGINCFAAGIHSKTDFQKFSMELALGIIGPHSYAGDFQNGIHKVNGASRAEGWDNQVEDEFLIELISETRWRLAHGDLNHNLSYDFIPHLGGRIGNVAVYVNTGAELRLGWNLPENFGTCLINAGCETSSAFGSLNMREHGPSGSRSQGIHLFISCDGRVVRFVFNPYTERVLNCDRYKWNKA